MADYKKKSKIKEEEIILDESLEQAEERLEFDSWYAINESKIPRHHYKEIILADFKGRGLSKCESAKKYDDALRKYGIKL